MSDSMVERVALVIAEDAGCTGYNAPIGNCVQFAACDCRRIACASIAAMREPTENMWKEGGSEIWEYDPGFTPSGRVARDAWIAMIDAALDDAP